MRPAIRAIWTIPTPRRIYTPCPRLATLRVGKAGSSRSPVREGETTPPAEEQARPDPWCRLLSVVQSGSESGGLRECRPRGSSRVGGVGPGCRFGLAKATAQAPWSSTPPLRPIRASWMTSSERPLCRGRRVWQVACSGQASGRRVRSAPCLERTARTSRLAWPCARRLPKWRSLVGGEGGAAAAMESLLRRGGSTTRIAAALNRWRSRCAVVPGRDPFMRSRVPCQGRAFGDPRVADLPEHGKHGGGGPLCSSFCRVGR